MSSSCPIVKTNYGPVKGVVKKTDIGKEYVSFQNIPYVKQPVGELRFKDPQPIEPWTEVLDATKEGPPAYSFDMFLPNGPAFVGGDNCLGLNIYTPSITSSKPMPVLVFIHGGGFICGSSSTEFYGPDYLVEHDVILVSINYRLNIFGFLSFNDPKVGIPGNAGLKDQSMALRWIKENISHFGGDPNNITIAGESAGGASVHYHLISDMSKGLFQKAIPMSGCSLNPWATAPPNYEEYLTKFVISLGLTGNEDDATKFKAINACDSMTLLKLDQKLMSSEVKQPGILLLSPFLPRVEPYVSKMCFLPKTPLEMSRNAWSKNIDVIFGGCSYEGLIFNVLEQSPEELTAINKDAKLLLPFDLLKQLDDKTAAVKGKVLKETYFDEPISKENLDKFFKFMSEKQFWHGIYRAAMQRQINDGQGKTYLYWLDLYPSSDVPDYYTFSRKLANTSNMSEACHAEDLPLIFKGGFVRRFQKGHDNFEAQQKFLDIFIQFMKTSNPASGLLKSTNWTAFPKGETTSLKCLNINRETAVVTELPNLDKIKVWNSLYEEHLL